MLSQLILERPGRVRTLENAQKLIQFLFVEIAQVLRYSQQIVILSIGICQNARHQIASKCCQCMLLPEATCAVGCLV